MEKELEREFDYEAYKVERNNMEAFINQIGFRTLEVSKYYCKGELQTTKMHANPIGSVHGGVAYAMADTLGGIAASTKGLGVTTVSGNMNYLNAARVPDKLIGEAKAVKVGNNLGVFDITIRNDKDVLIATATLTYYFLKNMPLEKFIKGI